MRLINCSNNQVGFVLSCFCLLAVLRCVAEEPVDYVDPFIGTAGVGHTTPAACVPFGLVQAGPDTGCVAWRYCSGYQYDDKAIIGFSQTHMNGTGSMDLGDAMIMPVSGDWDRKSSPMSRFVKSSEWARCGSYGVTLIGPETGVEVTATEHVACYSFAYRKSGMISILLDLQHGLVENEARRHLLDKTCKVAHNGRDAISGFVEKDRWVKRACAFSARFSIPFEKIERLPKWHTAEIGERYVISFHVEPPVKLLVKIALSAEGGVDAAKRNLLEVPGWDFDAVKDAARQKWNKVLGKAVIEGTDEQKKNWYTSLYHLCIQPNNIADVGEKPFYSTFSCWDTFRAAGPMYTILYPEKAVEFVDSMLEQGKKTGYLPIWTLWGEDNQCMIGTHSVPMIVDWFLKKGVVGSRSRTKDGKNSIVGLEPTTTTKYWESAYQQIKETLTKKHKGRIKENWDLYDQYGYYPFDKIRGESVSRTMECAYDDWCAGAMAEKLGHKEDAAFFFKRSAYWKNVFDPSFGLVRGKDTKGNWREPFDPYAFGHGADLANDFTEGNAFQYSWHVMQDVPGLMSAMGGREKFVKKLDALFEAPPKTEGMGCLVDITGLIGQYVHGNEPSHHVIYFYPQVGHPEKAAERIREVFDKFYLPKPDGLCGNDDCGQMSAWYLFSAMGFYPFNPCGGEYIIGAPQVPAAQVKVEGEGEQRTFRVLAKGLSKENKYVKTVTLNGKPITNWKIRHADITKGGELVFEMCNGEN